MELENQIGELTGLVKDLATELKSDVSDIKTRQEVMEASIRQAQEAIQKGFPIPSSLPKDPSLATPGMEPFFKGWDMAVQGKRLMDKIHHPYHQISDAKRLELAKYFVLFIKAAVFNDYKAREKFHELYGEYKLAVDVGDPGNVFPVPDILMTEILAFAREKSVLLRLGRIWEMTSEKQSFPAETPGSAAVYWGNETEEATPEIGEVELDAEELSAYSAVKNTTLADARSDIVGWLAEVMAEAAALELDDVGFNGDGTKAGCYGILSSQCGNTVTMGSGLTSFADLVYTNLSEMIAKLPGQRKIGARYFMSGDILHYVRTLKDDADRLIFIDPMGFDVPGRIFGYPYEEVIKMPGISDDAVSTAFMAFGNPQYFSIGRRLGSAALSVNPYDQWKRNRTLFKIYQRWALKMAMPLGFVRLVTAAA